MVKHRFSIRRIAAWALAGLMLFSCCPLTAAEEEAPLEPAAAVETAKEEQTAAEEQASGNEPEPAGDSAGTEETGKGGETDTETKRADEASDDNPAETPAEEETTEPGDGGDNPAETPEEEEATEPGDGGDNPAETPAEEETTEPGDDGENPAETPEEEETTEPGDGENPVETPEEEETTEPGDGGENPVETPAEGESAESVDPGADPTETEIPEETAADPFAEEDPLAELPLEGETEFALTVDYPETVTCGKPTTFTLNVTGAGDVSQCLYQLQWVYMYTSREKESVIDNSRTSSPYYSYRSTNTFEFTFYASGTYELRFYAMDKSGTPVTAKQTLEIVIDDPDYPSPASIVSSVADECKKNCSGDYERALWLHDWLVDHCAYDSSLLYCGAEGALARGKGTCESYHRAYCLLLDAVDISSGRITGNGHVWTAVKIDGKWCQVDVTWDDDGYSSASSDNRHLYFGLNDAITTLVHSDHTPRSGYVSDTLENNYFIRTGKVSKWSDPFVDEIKQRLAAGETGFTLAVESTEPAGYLDVKYNLAAYALEKGITEDAEGNACGITCSYADKVLTVTRKSTPTPTPAPTPVPELPAPEGLTVRAKSGAALLTWGRVSGAAGYTVYRAEEGTEVYTRIATLKKGKTVTYTDKKATPGKVYLYKAAAVDASGREGTISEPARFEAPLDQPAVKASRSKDQSQITLSWKAVTGASRYEVSVQTGGEPYLTDEPAGCSCSFAADPMATYAVTVRALSDAGIASAPAELRVTGSLKAPAPKLSLSKGLTELTVKLKPVKGAVSYLLYLSRDGVEGDPVLLSASETTVTFPIAPLGTYRARCIAFGETGAASPEGTASVKATMKAVSPTVKRTGLCSVSVSFKPVSPATGYALERSLSKSGPFTQVSGSYALTAKNIGVFTDAAAPGKTYYYRVRSLWSGTGLTGEETAETVSAAKTVTLPFAAPKPKLKQQKTGTRDISVTWSPVEGAFSYRLERSFSKSFTDPETVWTGADTAFTEEAPQACTTYYYRVTAVTVFEGTEVASAPGKIASIKTAK